MKNKQKQLYQGEKQIKALNTFKFDKEKLTIEDAIPKNAFNNDKAKKEFDKIKEIENTIDREKLVYKTNENTYGFRNFKTRNFGKDIYGGEITLDEADKDQSDLLNEIKNFSDRTRPKRPEKKTRKKNC